MADPFDPIAADIAREQQATAAPADPAPDYGDELAPLVRAPGQKAPAAPVVSEDDQLAQQMAAEQRQADQQQAQLLEWKAANGPKDAGRQTDVLRYSAASGLSPSFVDSNLDQVKAKVDATKVDWTDVAYRQPKLVSLLNDNPELVPLVKDDTANLGALEWSFKASFHAFWDALNEQRTIARQFLEVSAGAPSPELAIGARLLGGGSPENQAAIADLEAKYSGKDYGANNFFTKGVIGLFRMGPYLALDTAARLTGGFLGAAVGGAGGAAGGGAAGAPAAGVGAAPGAAGGGLLGGLGGGTVGQFVGSGLFNYYESVGPEYERLLKLKGADGKTMDPEVAQAFAQSSALVQGGMMAGFMGRVGGSIPGVKQLLAKVSGSAVDKALADVTATQAIKRGSLAFGQHWLTGGLMMASQSAINAASEEGAKGVSGDGFETHWGNVATAAGDGLKGGLEDMWLISALGPGREMYKEVGRARASAEDAVRLASMTQAARSSKLLERLPDAFEKAVKAMKSEPDAPQNVYVPHEEWTRYWQEKKVDPGQMAAAVMGDGGKGYAEAVNTKGDLAIPVERYLSKLGSKGSEHAEGLAPDSKLTPDSATPREQKAEQLRQDVELKQQAKVRGEEIAKGKAEVLDIIQEQARAAGIPKQVAESNAKLVSDYAGAMALRLGVGVHEAAALGSLGRLRILGPKGEAVIAGARERLQKFLSPEASTLIKDRLATMGTESRSREVFVDQNTGILNEKAFNEIQAPGQVAHISVEGIKYLNENTSHDRADLLYRAVAKAIHAEDPAAAKVGGDFAVRVKDQSQLDQLLKKVNEALPVKGFAVTGALGENFKAAGAAHGELKAAAEKAGTRAARGAKPLGMQGEAKDLVLPAERAKAAVPGELAQRIAGLTDAEYFKEAYVEPKTGLLTNEGWNAIPRKAHVAALDLKGLKLINDRFDDGGKTGDDVLKAFGVIAAHFGGSSFDFAHLHGDEYAAQHSDPLELARFLARLKEKVQTVGVEVTLPSGETTTAKLIDFRSDIGKGSYEAADRNLAAAKGREAPAGDRVPRDPQGQQGNGDHGGRQADLEGRGAPTVDSLGRGAQGQAWPGEVVAHVEGQPVTFLQKSYQEQKYKTSIDVRVTFPDGMVHLDAVKGINPGHALWRAKENWPGAKVESLGETAATDTLYQPPDGGSGGGGPRGSILMKLDPTGRPRAFDIRVLAGDKSTLLHETAHFLNWSLHDIATSDLATEAIKTDYANLLKWAGYGSTKERLFDTQRRAELAGKKDRTPAEEARLKELSAKEEKISHGWEQYLLEGKAPSEGLARVFSKFRQWMLSIYKGVAQLQSQYRSTYGQELGLSDEVRGIFDRLLADDDAISQAKADTGAPEAPAPWALGAMTQAQAAEYEKAIGDAKMHAERELMQRHAELKSNEAELTRARIRDEVTTALDQQPVYRAMRYLQHGELAGEKELPVTLTDDKGKPYKLNRAAFLKEYGKDVATLMPPGIFSADKAGGVEAEQLAPLLGFNDGAGLVDAFRKNEPRDKAIARQTQDRLDAEYGPALQKNQDAALSAVHNDAAARATLLELRALLKQVNPEAGRRARAVDPAALKATAERLVGETKVGQLDPARFARIERQTALKAAELRGAGEHEKAAEQLEARLLNQLLYRAARDAQDQLNRIHDKLDGTGDRIRAELGKADPAYRDAHDAVLEAVGIREGKAPAGAIDALVSRAQLDAGSIDFDLDALRELVANPTDWKDLSVDQAHQVADAAENIRHIARDTREVQIDGKRKEKVDYLKEVFARVASVRPPQPKDAYSQTLATVVEKGRHLRRAAQATLETMETWAHMMDGGAAGPFRKLFVEGQRACRDKAVVLNKKVLEVIREKWASVPREIRKLRGQLVDVDLPISDDFKQVMSRDQLWMLFLNWGNEGNRQRIRDGNGWDDAGVQKALEKLSKPETDFLQGVLDAVQSLGPEVQAAHERRTGLKLSMVEPSAITINGEQYRGGYFPLKYDSRGDASERVREGTEIRDMFASNYVRATTARGHTEARLNKVNKAVDLQWSVVQSHLSQVVHDLAYGDWVRQTASVLTDKGSTKPGEERPSFTAVAEKFLGPERSKELMPWLGDVANARVDSAAGHQSGFFKTMGSFAQGAISRLVMGLNVASLTRHSFDPWSMMADSEAVGPHWIAAAYLKVINPANWNHPIFEGSKAIAHHESLMSDNMRAELAKIGGGSPVVHAVDSVLFAAHGWVHHFTARVCFRAAYDQALAGGATPEEATKRGDDVLERALPSGDIAEKPPILRQKGAIAGAAVFYSYASKMHNLRARSFDDALRAWGKGEATAGDKAAAIATVAGKWLAQGAVGAMGLYLAGRGLKKDDKEDAPEWVAKELLTSPLDDLPIVGPPIKAVLLHHKPNVATAPGLSLVEQSVTRLQKLIESGKTKSDSDRAWAAAEALLSATGPGNAVHKAIGSLKEDRPRNAADVAAGLLYGPKKNRSISPLTQLGDLIQ